MKALVPILGLSVFVTHQMLKVHIPMPSNQITAKKGEIKIYYRGNVPWEDLKALESNLKKVGPTEVVSDAILMSDTGVPWTSAVVPITLIVIIGKGLLDGFLKEFGADGAKTLKTVLKEIFQRAQSNRQFVTLFPEGIPKKQKTLLKTPLISIGVHLGIEGLTARFDFTVNLDNTTASTALESLSEAISLAREHAALQTKEIEQFHFTYLEGKWRLAEKKKN